MPSLNDARLRIAWRPAMPISDSYMLQYLLQGTRSSAGSIQWQETEDRGFVTFLNGVRVEFYGIPTRTGLRLCVTFSCAASECVNRTVQVVEPVKSGIFSPAYDDENDRQLAELLRELSLAIHRQAYDRRQSGANDINAI